ANHGAAAAESCEQIKDQETTPPPELLDKGSDHIQHPHIHAQVEQADVHETAGKQPPPFTLDDVDAGERPRFAEDLAHLLIEELGLGGIIRDMANQEHIE